MIRMVMAALMMLVATHSWAEPLDRIIAVVDSEVVLESELQDMMKMVMLQLEQRNATPPPANVLRDQVLERVILQKLQLQRAEELGIRVTDEELNAALRQIASNNNMGLREFRNVLEQDGYQFSQFRNSIREEIIISRLHKSQVEDQVVVSDREVDNFLATQTIQDGGDMEYHLQHILISVPESASSEQLAAAQQQVEDILQQLAEGADFSELAITYSDGQNALEGGDLGWRRQGELPGFFAEVVPTLAVGEVSQPLRSGSGYHLIRLSDKKSQAVHLVKQTLASHILIETTELVSDEQAQERLESLRQRILRGEDFAELAKSNSDDTVSAIDGGSLGWVSSGEMVPEFEEQMNALGIGEVSQVFKSRFGWHLIKVFDRRELNKAEEYKRNQAREQIKKRKVDEELESWLRALRDESYVEYR